jgi:hypothetical protein
MLRASPEDTQLVDCRAYRVSQVGSSSVNLIPQRSSCVPVAPAEQRDGVRYAFDREVFCRKQGTQTVCFSLMGRCRNLSRTGIAVVLGCRIDPGTMMTVEVSATAKSEMRLLPVQVVHAHALPRRGWFLGCVFAEPLGEDELRRLGAI